MVYTYTGLLYIVDCSDRCRLSEAKEELYNIIEDDEMRGVPLIVMANKQDLYGELIFKYTTTNIY